jgi:hypothetical protein
MASVLAYFAGLLDMYMYIESDRKRKRTPHLTYGEFPIQQSQALMFASPHAFECPGHIIFL